MFGVPGALTHRKKTEVGAHVVTILVSWINSYHQSSRVATTDRSECFCFILLLRPSGRLESVNNYKHYHPKLNRFQRSSR